jgi:hypothetical protein
MFGKLWNALVIAMNSWHGGKALHRAFGLVQPRCVAHIRWRPLVDGIRSNLETAPDILASLAMAPCQEKLAQ